MIRSETTVYVDCDKCGFGAIVGDGPNTNIEFNASDAMTLAEHHGWSFDIDNEIILCPDCRDK